MLAVINTPHEDKPVALREVEEPSPAPNEALIEVAAFSVNRGELAQLNRLEPGWRPGQDVAGTVIREASDGSGPPVGARIVGLTEEAGWAERTPVRTDRLAVLSNNIRFEEAAVLPIPGLTALRALRRGGFLLDKSVMVTGATGIVGSLAIELAAAAGARVTAVARRDAHSPLRALGANQVIEIGVGNQPTLRAHSGIDRWGLSTGRHGARRPRRSDRRLRQHVRRAHAVRLQEFPFRPERPHRDALPLLGRTAVSLPVRLEIARRAAREPADQANHQRRARLVRAPERHNRAQKRTLPREACLCHKAHLMSGFTPSYPDRQLRSLSTAQATA